MSRDRQKKRITRYASLPKIFQCSVLVDLIGAVLHINLEVLGSLRKNGTSLLSDHYCLSCSLLSTGWNSTTHERISLISRRLVQLTRLWCSLINGKQSAGYSSVFLTFSKVLISLTLLVLKFEMQQVLLPFVVS